MTELGAVDTVEALDGPKPLLFALSPEKVDDAEGDCKLRGCGLSAAESCGISPSSGVVGGKSLVVVILEGFLFFGGLVSLMVKTLLVPFP